jgi:integrase
MAQFNYYLKNQKSEKETLISLRITHKGESVFLSTGLKVKPSSWCKDKTNEAYHSVLRAKEPYTAKQINHELYELLELGKKAEASFGNTPFTASELRNKILSFLQKEDTIDIKPSPKIDFYNFWDNYVLESSKKINPKTNKLITEHHLKCLRQTKSVLKRFEKHTRYKIDFSTLDLSFYQSFYKYCCEIEKFRTNSFGKHIRNLKGVLNNADIKGIKVKKEYKLSDFRSPRELTTSIFLTEAEIEKFIQLDLTEFPGLSRTRDFFVIGCFTGLRWSDFSNLNSADFSNNERIKIKTSKTQKNVTIPILPPLIKILEKYKKGDTYVFPKPISNQKFNSQLKEIAKKIPCLQVTSKYISNIGGKEIEETYKKWQMVCSHTCRRSFATNMYLRKIDVFLIMKITGHKTEKQFYEYIKIDAEESAINFLEQFNKST